MRTKHIILVAVLLVTAVWSLSRNRVTEVDEIKSHDLSADSVTQTYLRVLDLQLEPNTYYKDIDFGFTYTSFVMELEPDVPVTNAIYRTPGRAYQLDSIPVSDQPDQVRRSPFIVLDNPTSLFSLYSGSMQGKVRLYLMYAPLIKEQKARSLYKKTDACSKPSMVLGSTWREGLPDPIGPRSSHDVEHIIIHHSAGSNTRTDYTNIVRNIYLLHTQTNGWDDIGYNFLIAQDGTIFEGRDPQGAGDIDDIKGAHFCGKNSYTMGICLLGNYEEVAPGEPLLESLTNILCWKSFKDGIDVLDSTRHPSNTDPYLANIAGHRNGCATACPGDSVYRLLGNLRNDVDSILQTCSSTGVAVRFEDQVYWYEKENRIFFQSPKEVTAVNVFNSVGKQIDKIGGLRILEEVAIDKPNSGYYYVQLIYSDQTSSVQKILIP